MLDLKAIRADPDAARAALARRGRRRGARPGARARRAPPRAAARARGAARGEERGLASASASCSARAATPPRRSPRCARSATARRSSTPSCKAVEEELDAAARRAAQPARPRRGAARTRCCARSARRARPGTRPPRAARPPGRPGGGRARGRLALRLPQGPAGAAGAGAGALGARAAGRARVRARDPAGARARGGAATAPASCPTPSSRSTACPTTTSTWPAPARCRWPRCTPARSSSELPLRYAGFSPCFRREAGAAGKDTRGIFRVHQFDKVEMFSFVAPEESPAEHERLLAIEEELMQALGAALPRGEHRGRRPRQLGGEEVRHRGVAARARSATASSPRRSNTTDYQARRLDIRFRPPEGKGTAHVHTLNGTAVAVGRTIIALVENGQQEDGSVVLPEVLARVRRAGAARAVARLIYTAIASLDGYVADERRRLRLGGPGRGGALVRERPRAGRRHPPPTAGGCTR